MATYSEHVISVLRSELVSHNYIDMPTVVMILESQNTSPSEAFWELLQDRSTAEWHYYAVAGMRTLAEQNQLPPEQVEPLLDATNRLALRMGLDEFYMSIDAVARSRRAAPALLDFATQRLLARQDIEEWRWLAFATVGAVYHNQTAPIPSTLVEQLRREAANVDSERQPRVQGFLNNLPDDTATVGVQITHTR
jgi:hypothetical protein